MKDMKILTVVTDRNNYGLVNYLLPSVSQHKLNMVILSYDDSEYQSHRVKDYVIHKYLKKIRNSDIIFFTDGYDTLFLSNTAEILKKYYVIGKRLLFSAEINCWPYKKLSKEFPAEKSPFKYLCSGGFIGEAGLIKKHIEEKIETNRTLNYPFSNQIYWAEKFLKNQTEIGLDTKCEIFATLSSKLDMQFFNRKNRLVHFHKYNIEKVQWFHKNFLIKRNRLYVVRTKSTPCHLHANGFSKVLEKELAKLQLFEKQ